MKKVLILGGSLDQKKLVDEFNSRGFYTIIVDYYKNPISKKFANKHYQVSTHDKQGVLEIAKKEKVDYVSTISADQPVLVAAYVCDKLGLKSNLSYKQALDSTNKLHMKSKFVQNNIPTSKYTIIKNRNDFKKIKQLNFPIIIKPVDSSGSRGVFIVKRFNELDKMYSLSKNASQTNVVIAEEFINGKIITGDLLIKDFKIIVKNFGEGNIKFLDGYTPTFFEVESPFYMNKDIEKRIENIIEKICKIYNVKDSSLLIQFIINDKDIYIIEFSFRIGGGLKPYIIPIQTGVDFAKECVSLLINGSYDNFEINYPNKKYNTVYLWANKGVFNTFYGLSYLMEKNIISNFFSYVKEGDLISSPKKSSDRIGMVLIEGDSKIDIVNKREILFDNLKVLDKNNKDLLIDNRKILY